MRRIFTAILCFLFPAKLIFWLLNLMGHKIHPRAKIGFSLIFVKEVLILEESARISHFNLIRLNNLSIKTSGYIEKFNNINGPFDIVLEETAAIGNRNTIYRAPLGVTYNKAILKLGILSKITGNHRVDCTRSITIGDYTTIAGHDSQLWTHAYYHDKTGKGRFRVDGEIEIGSNVYIGSRCVITGGVKIADKVVVGANACVSKSLEKAGTYVNQGLRFIEMEENLDQRSKFQKVEGYTICEEVYEKKV